MRHRPAAGYHYRPMELFPLQLILTHTHTQAHSTRTSAAGSGSSSSGMGGIWILKMKSLDPNILMQLLTSVIYHRSTRKRLLTIVQCSLAPTPATQLKTSPFKRIFCLYILVCRIVGKRQINAIRIPIWIRKRVAVPNCMPIAIIFFFRSFTLCSFYRC